MLLCLGWLEIGLWRQVEQFTVLGAIQVLFERLFEPVFDLGVNLDLALDDRADEDQPAGTALAFGGGDAGLGTADLAFEGFFPDALSFQEFFFPLLEFLVQGLLAFQ